MPARLISFDLIIYPDHSSNYTARKRCYRISITGRQFVFERKADAVSFCDRLSDMVTLRVRDLNRLTVDVYSEYRRRCLSMPAIDCEDCARDFMAVDKQISVLLRRAHHSSSGYILAQQHVSVWSQCLLRVLDRLSSCSVMRADTEARAAVRICRERINAALRDMELEPGRIYRELTD